MLITLFGRLTDEGTIIVSSQLSIQLSNWSTERKNWIGFLGEVGYCQLLQNNRGAYYLIKFLPKG